MSWNEGGAGPFGRNNDESKRDDESEGATSEQHDMPGLPPLPPLGLPGDQATDDGAADTDAASDEQELSDAAGDEPESNGDQPESQDSASPAADSGGWSSFAPPAYGSTPEPVSDEDARTDDEAAHDGAPTQSFSAALGSDGDVNAARDDEPHDPNATQAYPTQAFPAGGFGGSNERADAQATRAYPTQAFRTDEPATQAFGAPPAAFPGDTGAQYGQPAGPAPAAGGAGGQEPPRPEEKRKKPWFRRPPILITIIAVLVLGLAAGIGIPWFINSQNVQRGDDLAAAFQSELKDYNATWNEENLAAVTAPDISTTLSSSSQTFFDFTSDGIDDLSAACGDIAGAQETRQQLADADVPELPQDEGAEASEAYVAAQKDAKALTDSRESADAFLEQSNSLLTAQQQLCDSIPAYAELQQNYRSDLDTTMPDAYVVENGGEITTSDGAIYFPCSNSQGCPDLYNDDNRELFASAYESTYVDYYSGLAEQYTDNCFLDAFQSVCDVAAEKYQAAADANQAVVDHLRENEPTVEVGQTLYPDLDGLIQDAADAESAANEAVLTEWAAIEPNVGTSMTRTGSSLATFLDSLKSTADETGGCILG
jgi:hypothetical protein